MPTYPYTCTVCGYAFEKEQRMSDEPLVTCPECGGELKHVINGGIGFLFKGSRESLPTRCGNSQTCCGRDTRYDNPPCSD